MRYLLLLLLLPSIVQAKERSDTFPTKQTVASSAALYISKGGLTADSGFVNTSFPDTLTATRSRIADYAGGQIRVGNTIYVRDSTKTRWIPVGGTAATIAGGYITSLPAIGDYVGVNITSEKFIDTTFFRAQPPLASLSGGSTLELHSAGTFTATLNWGATRQLSTAALNTINVAGVNQTFTAPAAGASVSGTKSVTATYNTPQTFTNTVTTVAPVLTASATTSFSYLPKRYWGYSSGTPVAADLLASNGGGQELSNSFSKTGFVVTVTGSTKKVFFAYPASLGATSSVIVTGLESVGAFTQSTISVTNASGYVQNYIVVTSNNTFSNTTISFNSIN